MQSSAWDCTKPGVRDNRGYSVNALSRSANAGTAYLEPEAFQQLRLVMVREDTTMQALLIEGINAVFAKRNLSRIA
ncbi:ribbon-helix-helix domain-containing protein [uncultured Methylobacterium sp.]|uniref:ribbon-helix-helix domain-containing protein n=1 Tax=uncultured Methylobacterium sp. TaxID=157278 RepID=UPI0035CB1C08